MRFVALAASALIIAACGEQQAPEPPPAMPPAPESSAERPPGDADFMSVAEISFHLVGEFRSTQDEKATIAVTSDGKWVESYEGAEPTTYAWRVFTGDQSPPDTTETFTPTSRYLELKADDQVFYYEMGTVSEDGFDMFYMPRGNMLSYARIKAPA